MECNFWILVSRICGWRFAAQLRPMAGKTTLLLISGWSIVKEGRLSSSDCGVFVVAVRACRSERRCTDEDMITLTGAASTSFS